MKFFLLLAEYSLPLTVLLYINQAILDFYQGKNAFGFVFICYAFANVGLMMAQK